MIHQVTFKIGTTWHTGAFDDVAGTFVTQQRKEDTARPRAVVQKPPKTVRWLGMDWDGLPWPKRLRLRLPFYISPARGCGCLKKPKAAWRRVLNWVGWGAAWL